MLTGALPTSLRKRLAIGLGLLVAGLYAVQVASPLRLTPDVVVYLSMAMSALGGKGLIYEAAGNHYATGYAALVAGLDRLGLGTSVIFVALNLLFLGLAVASLSLILSRAFRFSKEEQWVVILLTVLSWVMVKFTVIPLSDVPYFGASLASLAVVVSIGGSRWPWGMLLALLLTVAAIALRGVGVALLPALAWGLSGRMLRSDRWLGMGKSKRRAILASVAGGGLAIVATRAPLFTLGLGEYLNLGGMPAALGKVILTRLQELGELAVNIPAARMPGALESLLPLVGGGVTALVAAGAWSRRRTLTAPEIYLLAYLAILIVWPFGDPRYWLPIVPLLVAWGLLGLRTLARPALARLGGLGYIAVYGLIGLVALGYETWITLAGPAIGEVYGHETYGETYRAAFGRPFDSQEVNRDALRVLLRYEPRARSSPANQILVTRPGSQER